MAHLKCDSMFRCLDMERAYETDTIVKKNGLIYMCPDTETPLLMRWCPFCGNELKTKETQNGDRILSVEK